MTSKLLLQPLLVLVLVAGRLAMAAGLPLDPLAAAVLVLVAALPNASKLPILAERFRADAGLPAHVVLASTISAFVSFTVAVASVDARTRAPAAASALGPAR